MQKNHFQHSVKVQAPLSDVYAYLTEYLNTIHLHPLIVEIKEFPANEPHKSTMEVKYKFELFGIISVYKNYQTIAEAHPSDCSITMKTTALSNIYIETERKLHANKDDTVIIDHLSVEAPSLLASFTTKQVNDFHSSMLAA